MDHATAAFAVGISAWFWVVGVEKLVTTLKDVAAAIRELRCELVKPAGEGQ